VGTLECPISHQTQEVTVPPSTAIDAATLQAYLDTDYRVDAQPPFTLRVGEASPALAALHQARGVECSAFVSACNPLGALQDEATNDALHERFGLELERRGIRSVEGVGLDPSGEWPGEASRLVLGVELEDAMALGRSLEQNAIVWSGPDAKPQLILLR